MCHHFVNEKKCMGNFFLIMWEKNVLYLKFVTILSMKKNLLYFLSLVGENVLYDHRMCSSCGALQSHEWILVKFDFSIVFIWFE